MRRILSLLSEKKVDDCENASHDVFNEPIDIDDPCPNDLVAVERESCENLCSSRSASSIRSDMDYYDQFCGFGNTPATNQTPFGQTQQFGKTNPTPGFGSTAPLFGATPQQAGSSLFQSSTFGAQPTAGFGSALFGQQQPASQNALFPNANVSTFGQQNKTPGFGFAASPSSNLFGQQPQQAQTTFQPSNPTGVFGSASSFGAGMTQLGTVIKFNPVTGTDTMQKSGITHSISTKHHCITCMKEYETKSLEELRWEDYQSNRKGPQQQSSFGAAPFGASTTSAPSLFGQTDNKTAFASQPTSFGAGTNGFGLGNQTGQQSLFNKTGGTFGPTPTTNTFGFNASANAFGVNNTVKPFSTPTSQNVFSTPITQQSTFGSSLFAPTTAQPNPGSFFTPKAATGFNTQQPVFAFGQNNLFQTPKSTSGFGSSFAQPTLTTNTAFQQPNNLFGPVNQNPFTLQKPPQTGFGPTVQQGFLGSQPQSNPFFGNTSKPLFGTNTSNNFFGGNTGFMMPQQQQTMPINFGGAEYQQAAPQPPEFTRTVEQIFEFFPRPEYLKDLPKVHESTNPEDLIDILNGETPRQSITSTKAKSRLRDVPKTSPTYTSDYKLQKEILLNDVVDGLPIGMEPTKGNGRRLMINKLPHLNKNPEFNGSLSVVDSNSTSMFRNIQTLQDTSAKSNDKSSPFTMNKFRINSSSEFNAESPRNASFNESVPVVEMNSPITALGGPSRISSGVMKNFDNVAEKKKTNSLRSEEDVAILSTPESNKRFLGLSDKGPNIVESSPTSSILSKKGKAKIGKTVSFVDSDFPESTSTPKNSWACHIRTLEERVEGLHNTSTEAEKILETVDETIGSPCGVILKRREYYTVPPLNELAKYQNENGSCVLKGFTIGRTGYGNIYFPGQIDVANLDLDATVHFLHQQVHVYPDHKTKPAVGQGLNRPAQVTLERIWPKDPVKKELVLAFDETAKLKFLERLCYLSDKQDAKFVDYRPETGSWVFTVEHFSKYTYVDEDEDDEKMSVTKDSQDKDLANVKTTEVSEEVIKKDLGGMSLNEVRNLELSDLQYKKKPQKVFHKTAQTLPYKGLPTPKNRSLDEINLSGLMYEDESDKTISSRFLPGRSAKHYEDLKEISALDNGSGLYDIPEIQDVTEIDSYMDETDGYNESMHFKRVLRSRNRDLRDFLLLKASINEEPSVISDDSSSEPELVTYSTPFIIDQAPISRLDHIDYFTLNNYVDVPLNKSLLTSRNLKDAALFKLRSHKVGWNGSKPFLLINQALDYINLQEPIDNSYVMLTKLKLESLSRNYYQINLEEHLTIMLEESNIVNENSGLPLFTIKDGCRSLIRHGYIAEHFDRELNYRYSSYFSEVWSLCAAFWGPNANTPTERLELFSKWLENSCTAQMNSDLVTEDNKELVLKNIFTYLTGHRIEEAAQLALDENLPILGTLITNCSSEEESQNYLKHQLDEWKENDMLGFMDKTLLKIYALLSGSPIMEDVNVCEGLDWKRALAIHLWYMTPPGTSLLNAIRSYREACKEFGYAKSPVPSYCNSDAGVHDLQYHIIELFENCISGLNTILDPITHTDNPLDYRLSWLLLQVFAALRQGTVSEECTSTIHLNFAAQLEDEGKWKWAIFVLLYVKDVRVKKNAIMSVLYRNMKVDRLNTANVQIEDYLVNYFKLSPQLLHTVLADKSETFGLPLETYKHLTLLGDWTKAHSVATFHIIPALILSGQVDELVHLLKSLEPGSGQISTWSRDVGLIIEFLQLRQTLIKRRSDFTNQDLHKIGSKVIKLCNKIKSVKTVTTLQTVGLVEISKFYSELLFILYTELHEFIRLNEILHKLDALVMPPDIKNQELSKYFNSCLELTKI